MSAGERSDQEAQSDVDDLLDPVPDRPTDPEQAYDGGWEQGLEEGDGFEDHLLGEAPTTPEL